MTTRNERLREFHTVFGHPIRERPTTDVPEKEVRLRARLIVEETLEVVEALYGLKIADWLKDSLFAFLDNTDIKTDLVDLTDGLADLDYVVEGARLTFGIDGEEIEEEVHRSNMAKAVGCTNCNGEGSVQTSLDLRTCGVCNGAKRVSVKDAYGKAVKPPGWTPPDIAGVLARQKAR